ncbi:MAG: glycosyltransferase family 4 protein [Elainellaceae cyanobacterium]
MFTKPIRVGFLSSHNYLDINTFSGTLYYMHKALQRHGDVELIDLGEPWEPYFNYGVFRKVTNKFYKKRTLDLGESSSEYFESCNRFASIVKNQLRKNPCDLIFAPIASQEISCLPINQPLIYLSDATFNSLRRFYKFDFDQQKIDLLERVESTAIARANQLIYSSQWAAESAISDYGAFREKINIIPFGANLENIPSEEDICYKQHDSKCRLLFIGKSWSRKGGDTAYQSLISLLALGVDAELTVVGCTPPSYVKHRQLHVIPYLDKNIAQQRRILEQIFLRSHFLLFPTRADCSPIVICEANAYGLPVITTDVGGISSIVRNGVNGHMLSLSASGQDYASLIAAIFCNPTSYRQLLLSARREFDRQLNWNSWANSSYKVMQEALTGTSSQLIAN